MSEGEALLMELVAELTYSLDAVIRRPSLAEHFKPTVAKSKEYILTHCPQLAARLYD